MMDFIERLRAKPVHIRQRYAVGAAGGITAVVALGWIIAFTSSDALKLQPINPDDDTSNLTASVSEGSKSVTELFGGGYDDASVTVVETRASSTLDQPTTNETVIPF